MKWSSWSNKHIWGRKTKADRISTYKAEKRDRIDKKVNDTKQKKGAEKLPTVEIISQNQIPQKIKCDF